MNKPKTIGLIIKPKVPAAEELAKKIITYVKENKLSLILEEKSSKLISIDVDSLPADKLATKADLIVSLGGDGTLISIARHSTNPPPLMLGVNFGTLGFLTEIAPLEFFDVFKEALNANAKTGRRRMLSVTLKRDKKIVYQTQAINDAVIQKSADNKLIELDVEVGGEDVFRIKSDGVIVSTPVGSTAYCLSAGGAIVHPSLSVMEITSICTHSLTFRPLVLPMDYMVKIRVPNHQGDILLMVDGQESIEIEPNDYVEITESSNSVEFVRSPKRTYFEVLRTKLNWNINNHNSNVS
ncbi:MAG: NAD(+)/NADH kinase [Bdellovibrionales bacterium]|nr:NAD(+)/NADH kinase [Bdellovibrionales bacterium]